MPEVLPSLSCVMTTYNREDYIMSALKSTFEQDYAGELEIIISDDCSTDNTWDIVQEAVSQYTGPHKIITTRTPHNMKLAGNTNHALQFVTKDWVVRADDDDISLLNRCSIIAKLIQSHPHIRGILLDTIPFMDDAEIPALEAQLPQTPTHDITEIDLLSAIDPFRMHGGGKVWHTEVYRAFGPMNPEVYIIDDVNLYCRALVLGGVIKAAGYPSHYMRKAGGNMSGYAIIDYADPSSTRGMLAAYASFQEKSGRAYPLIAQELNSYIAKHPDALPAEQLHIITSKCESNAKIVSMEGRWWSMSLWQKITHLGLLPVRNSLILKLAYLLPFSLFVHAFSTMHKIKKLLPRRG